VVTIHFPHPVSADTQITIVDPATVSWTIQSQSQPAPDQIRALLHAPGSPANGYFTVHVAASGYSPFVFTVQIGS